MILKLFALGAAVLLSASAHAQYPSPNPQTVYQSGGVGSQITPRHPAMWITNGVIGDAGPASGGAAGTGFAELGITNTGTPFCINDAPVTSLTGYHQLCLGANALGGGLLSYQSYATAPILPFNFNIDGSVLLSMAPGAVTTITPQLNDSSTKIATTEFVNKQIQQGASVLYPANNVLHYGADPTGVGDNSAAFNAAFVASCATSLYVPPGTYKFTAGSTSGCGLKLIMDPAAVIVDAMPPTTLSTVFAFSGTQGVSTLLTGDALAGATTAAVTDASGFCQPATASIPDPACAVLLWDTNTWDPTINSHNPGEIKLIQSISGNTLTLFNPVEGNYRTTHAGAAIPVSLLNRPTISGGTFQGPTQDNNHHAFRCFLCWDASVSGVTFKYFGGEGAVEWNNAVGFADSGNTYIGLGSLSTGSLGDAYFTAIVDASEYGVVHDNLYWNGGPCVTVADSGGGVPGTTRHMNFHHNQCYGARAFNSYQMQTHFQGEDINFYGNTISNIAGVTGNSKGISVGIANVVISDNTVWNVSGAYGIQVENGTNQQGYVSVRGNAVYNATSHCILVQQTVSGSTGFFSQIKVEGNILRACGGYGVEYIGGGPSVDSNVSISSNNINIVGSGFIGILINNNVQIFGIDNNTILVNNANNRGIFVTDSAIGTIANNKIKMAAGNTSEAITHNCGSVHSGSNVSIDNNILNSPSDVSGTGVSISNNCTSDNIGYNDVAGFTTGFHPSSGAGNRITGPLNGLTGTISPSAGTCASGNATIAGIFTGARMKVTVAPDAYPGDFVNYSGFVSGANTVAVHVCAAAGSTPVATAYSVAVTQ